MQFSLRSSIKRSQHVRFSFPVSEFISVRRGIDWRGSIPIGRGRELRYRGLAGDQSRIESPPLGSPRLLGLGGGGEIGSVTEWPASSRCTKLPPGSELIASSSHPKTLSGASARRMPKWQV